MSRISFFIVVFSLFSSVAMSQDEVNFNNIDLQTYGFASFSEWDSVIHYGKLGLANNIDYFYLRLRMGEAYYYKQKYAPAIKQFEKALKSNSGDTTTQEFLYYSYLFSGRESDARNLGYKMTDDIKKDVHLKKNISLKDVYFETGQATSNNISQNGSINLAGSENLGGSAALTNNISYTHIGMDINIGKWLSIYPGVSFVNDEDMQLFQTVNYAPGGRSSNVSDTVVVHPPRNGHPAFTSYDTVYNVQQLIKSSDTAMNFKYKLKQTELYLKCNIHVAKGLDIVPFFHLLSVKTINFKANNSTVNVGLYDSITRHTQVPKPPSSSKDTIVYHDTSYVTPIQKYNYSQKDTSFYNYAFGLAINKNWGRVTTSLFASYSNLNNYKQKEGGLTVTWYPEGNLNLYFSSTITAIQEDTIKHIDFKHLPGIKNMVFNQVAGTKICKYIWLEGFVTLGTFSDFTESNGFVVDNNTDPVMFRCGIKPILVFKRFDISLTYEFIQKQSSYITDMPQNTYITNTTKYRNNFIIGGVKWKL